jgi:hypothetical protein
MKNEVENRPIGEFFNQEPNPDDVVAIPSFESHFVKEIDEETHKFVSTNLCLQY